MNFTEYLFLESKSLQKNFVIGSNEQITFQELYQKSSNLAGYLRSQYGTGNNVILQIQLWRRRILLTWHNFAKQK